jgi:tripartite-type tricarboxylate transporter receptor subunit TctC
VIAQLNAQAMAALRRPELAERLAVDGSEPFSSSVAEFAAFMRAEHAKWGAAVRDASIRPIAAKCRASPWRSLGRNP